MSMPKLQAPRQAWLTRNLVVLCGVSFLQDAATELLYPILPIFLTVTLGAPAAVIGLVEGLAEGAAATTKLAAGRWADRWARRPLVGLGYGLAAVGKALIAVATAWPVVLAGRAVDRLGKGIRGAPRDALLADGVPTTGRGRVFGLHRAADTAGAVVGPLIGLAAYAALDHRIRPLLRLRRARWPCRAARPRSRSARAAGRRRRSSRIRTARRCRACTGTVRHG
jgi:MFS family permease